MEQVSKSVESKCKMLELNNIHWSIIFKELLKTTANICQELILIDSKLTGFTVEEKELCLIKLLK